MPGQSEEPQQGAKGKAKPRGLTDRQGYDKNLYRVAQQQDNISDKPSTKKEGQLSDRLSSTEVRPAVAASSSSEQQRKPNNNDQPTERRTGTRSAAASSSASLQKQERKPNKDDQPTERRTATRSAAASSSASLQKKKLSKDKDEKASERPLAKGRRPSGAASSSSTLQQRKEELLLWKEQRAKKADKPVADRSKKSSQPGRAGARKPKKASQIQKGEAAQVRPGPEDSAVNQTPALASTSASSEPHDTAANNVPPSEPNNADGSLLQPGPPVGHSTSHAGGRIQVTCVKRLSSRYPTSAGTYVFGSTWERYEEHKRLEAEQDRKEAKEFAEFEAFEYSDDEASEEDGDVEVEVGLKRQRDADLLCDEDVSDMVAPPTSVEELITELHAARSQLIVLQTLSQAQATEIHTFKQTLKDALLENDQLRAQNNEYENMKQQLIASESEIKRLTIMLQCAQSDSHQLESAVRRLSRAHAVTGAGEPAEAETEAGAQEAEAVAAAEASQATTQAALLSTPTQRRNSASSSDYVFSPLRIASTPTPRAELQELKAQLEALRAEVVAKSVALETARATHDIDALEAETDLKKAEERIEALVYELEFKKDQIMRLQDQMVQKELLHADARHTHEMQVQTYLKALKLAQAKIAKYKALAEARDEENSEPNLSVSGASGSRQDERESERAPVHAGPAQKRRKTLSPSVPGPSAAAPHDTR